SRVFRLEALTSEDLEQVARRGLRELGAEIDPAALAAALEAARGDARIVLNALEAAAVLASHGNPDGTGSARIELTHIEKAMQERHLLYDRAGDMHFDLA